MAALAFNGVGILKTVSLTRDQSASNPRPDVSATETDEPVSSSSGVVLLGLPSHRDPPALGGEYEVFIDAESCSVIGVQRGR